MNAGLDQICKYLWNCSRENKTKGQSRNTISLVMSRWIAEQTDSHANVQNLFHICFRITHWESPILHTDTTTDVAITKLSNCVLVYKWKKKHTQLPLCKLWRDAYLLVCEISPSNVQLFCKWEERRYKCVSGTVQTEERGIGSYLMHGRLLCQRVWSSYMEYSWSSFSKPKWS